MLLLILFTLRICLALSNLIDFCESIAGFSIFALPRIAVRSGVLSSLKHTFFRSKSEFYSLRHNLENFENLKNLRTRLRDVL